MPVIGFSYHCWHLHVRYSKVNRIKLEIYVTNWVDRSVINPLTHLFCTTFNIDP